MTDLLRVMYFSNSTVRGGAEEHILTLLHGLDRRRFRSHFVCPHALANVLGGDVPPDVEVLPLSLRKPTDVESAVRLARLISARRIDVLHSHLFYASMFASPIGRVCGVPAIIETPHVRELWRRGWIKRRFIVDRAVGRFVDRYIAVSEANGRYLAEVKGLPAKKIVVIHNGADVARFAVGAATATATRRAALDIGPDDPVLLMVGRLEPQKGHRVLLEALPAVRRRFPRVTLVCVGEGSLLGVLQHQSHALGLDGAVRFVGYQSKPAEWFALADVTVLPSLFEGLPLVAVESLAAGRPVVATAVDGTPEVVLDGKTGLTVPPDEPGSLAAAICRLLDDPEERGRLGRQGRRWVEQRFTHEHQVEKTQALYFSTWRERRQA